MQWSVGVCVCTKHHTINSLYLSGAVGVGSRRSYYWTAWILPNGLVYLPRQVGFVMGSGWLFRGVASGGWWMLEEFDRWWWWICQRRWAAATLARVMLSLG